MKFNFNHLDDGSTEAKCSACGRIFGLKKLPLEIFFEVKCPDCNQVSKYFIETFINEIDD